MGSKSSLMLQDEEIRQIGEATGFSQQQIEKLYSRFTQLDRNSCGSLSKNDLLSIPELAVNPLGDRLIELFFSDHLERDAPPATPPAMTPKSRGHLELAREQEDRINFRQFMRVLAAFRSASLATGRGSIQGLHKQDEAALAHGPQRPRMLRAADHKHSSLVDSLGDCLRDKLYFLFEIYDVDGDGRISFNDLRDILKLMVGSYIEELQLDKIATRAFLEVDRDNDGFVEFGEFCKMFAGKDLDDKLRVKFF